MPTLAYTRHERLNLKTQPEFNEKWLQDRIAEDPSILGLGEVILIDRERVQERAGRLDLLLADPEQNRRYEVELMLGATDESHIIRSIEYWDIERRRYPGYEHCAVIVAEDITSRFLNVLSLLAGTVPLIAIQLNALQVGNSIVLDFVRVLDQRLLRQDDEVEAKMATTDRAYWNEKASPKALGVLDELLGLVNEHAQPKLQPNFNKYYIGMTDGVRIRNFIAFKPRKQFVNIMPEVSNPEDWQKVFEEAGFAAGQTGGRLRVPVAPGDVKKHQELLTKLIQQSIEENQD